MNRRRHLILTGLLALLPVAVASGEEATPPAPSVTETPGTLAQTEDQKAQAKLKRAVHLQIKEEEE